MHDDSKKIGVGATAGEVSALTQVHKPTRKKVFLNLGSIPLEAHSFDITCTRTQVEER